MKVVVQKCLSSSVSVGGKEISKINKGLMVLVGFTHTDTQKEIDDEGFIVRHLVRSNLVAVQTPQCFKFKELLEAHGRAATDGREYTDDTEIWGEYSGRVRVTKGDVNNIKITYPSDLEKL